MRRMLPHQMNQSKRNSESSDKTETSGDASKAEVPTCTSEPSKDAEAESKKKKKVLPEQKPPTKVASKSTKFMNDMLEG